MTGLCHEELRRLGFFYCLGMLKPSSPYGRELARNPRFFAPEDREALETEWNNIEKGTVALCKKADAVARLRHCFSQLRDIRVTLRRIMDDWQTQSERRNGAESLDEIELFEVKRFLLQLALIVPIYKQTGAAFVGITINETPEALLLLDPDGTKLPAYSVYAAPSSPLREARNKKAALEAALREQTDEEERKRLLEERRLWASKEEVETRLEMRRLTVSLRPYAEALLQNAQSIGRVDYLLEKARLATERDCVMPVLIDKGVRFVQMVNPRLDDLLREHGSGVDGGFCPETSDITYQSQHVVGFTPLSIDAPRGATVITGANMGGKSVAIRTLALNILLCQAGFFAFAKRAEVSLFDCLHVIMGNQESEERGVSSFVGEIIKIERLLSDIKCGKHCFSIIDEPARGTNPEEGAALLKALLKKLSDGRSVSVVTTHFDDVSGVATARYRAAGFYNLPDKMPEGAGVSWIIKHLRYGLLPDDGSPLPRHALTVCRLLGLNRDVVEEMERIMKVTNSGQESESAIDQTADGRALEV